MNHVLVLGAGKIGSLIACLLNQSGRYDVHLGDMTLEASITKLMYLLGRGGSRVEIQKDFQRDLAGERGGAA